MSKHQDKHRRGGNFIFTIFRMILSLIVLTVLILVGYQAYKNFSGADPLKISPQSLAKSLLNNESVYKIFNKALSFDPTNSLSKLNPATSPKSHDSVQPPPAGPVSFKFAIVSDTHNDNDHLQKAIQQAKDVGASFVIGLGDYSDVGTLDELTATKKTFQEANLPYYSTAGDHDLWDSRNRKLDPSTNYSQVFGSTYSSFGYQKARFILMYDADNYNGVNDVQRRWIEQELVRNRQAKPIFVLTSIPLYHPSSDHVLGKVNSKFKTQADELINLFKQNNIAHLFSGDTHFYSSYVEPRSSLRMTTVGAITSTRNAQAPRFAMVDVYESGEYTITDSEIK